MAKRWGGHESRKARAQWRPKVAQGVPCCRCGGLVVPRPWLPHDGWEPDHYPVPRWKGGKVTWPAHSPECNQSEGGKDGARITNARRAERREITRPSVKPALPFAASEQSRGIRGV
ncbi:MAG: hypothetical protein CVT65_14495 [Actinobacteria bacterium HGW-Actinobacteria-5]|jgi:hypothetical protein|nr:MAG: hypothetical protein CVT65_14495 [Actinobacteria bacterium HGW-Actinobacteria-5]